MRRERAQLVPDVLRARAAEVVAEPARELVDDLDVVARLARRVERLAHALHAALARGHRSLGLAERRRGGQHDVGELRRLRQEEVLHDEMVEPFEQADRALLVGFALRRVLADHVDRRERAVLHRLEHAGEVQADRSGRSVVVPRRLRSARGRRRRRERWKPGQPVRDRAHVTAALHVVLPAQRLHARAVAADVAAEQREVDQREDVVDRVVVLGDPERPADLRAVRLAEQVRRLVDRIGGNPRHARRLVERPLLDGLAERVVAGRRALDELRVHELRVDELARDRVRERDVGADIEAEPQVRPLRRRGAARDRRRSASRRS